MERNDYEDQTMETAELKEKEDSIESEPNTRRVNLLPTQLGAAALELRRVNDVLAREFAIRETSRISPVPLFGSTVSWVSSTDDQSFGRS